MGDRPQGRAPVRGQTHFGALYQGKPPVEGVEFALDVPPWDIGEPQPALVALERSGALRSDILDAGCGCGDNALFLAECGYRVTGFDAAPAAIAQACQRARARGIELQFVLADATRLEGLEPCFNTVLDSGLYHCLSDEQCTDYAAALHRGDPTRSPLAPVLLLRHRLPGPPDAQPGPARPPAHSSGRSLGHSRHRAHILHDLIHPEILRTVRQDHAREDRLGCGHRPAAHRRTRTGHPSVLASPRRAKVAGKVTVLAGDAVRRDRAGANT
jgi:SAM-dependent methyltransferase